MRDNNNFFDPDDQNFNQETVDNNPKEEISQNWKDEPEEEILENWGIEPEKEEIQENWSDDPETEDWGLETQIPMREGKQIVAEEEDKQESAEEEFYRLDEEERSEKRRGMNKKPVRSTLWGILRPFIAIAISIVIVGGGILFALQYVFKNYLSPVDVNNSETKEIVVKRGMSLSDISDMLYEQNIIRNKSVFKYYVDFSDMSAELQAGTYRLSQDMTMEDIINVMKKGDGSLDEVKVMLAEGLTAEDMEAALVKKKAMEKNSDYLEICKTGGDFKSYYFVKEVLENIEETGDKRKYVLEGYLFPDTYRVYANSTGEEVLKKQLSQFNTIFSADYLARADELGMSVDEVVTLASLIEREGKTQDFKKISAVFHNRLKENMRLESCATLQYITGIKKYVFSEKERNIDSPYNTYRNKGLPAGPISNPGKKAIDAALYPDEEFMKEGYLFFCLAEPDSGELLFAKTLKEHQKNVDKYQKSWIEYDNKKTQGAS